MSLAWWEITDPGADLRMCSVEVTVETAGIKVQCEQAEKEEEKSVERKRFSKHKRHFNIQV